MNKHKILSTERQKIIVSFKFTLCTLRALSALCNVIHGDLSVTRFSRANVQKSAGSQTIELPISRDFWTIAHSNLPTHCHYATQSSLYIQDTSTSTRYLFSFNRRDFIHLLKVIYTLSMNFNILYIVYKMLRSIVRAISFWFQTKSWLIFRESVLEIEKEGSFWNEYEIREFQRNVCVLSQRC